MDYLTHIYTGFNDDVMGLSLVEIDDEEFTQEAWEQWCASHPDGEYDLEDF